MTPKQMMTHPAETQLALFAGRDLGRWDRWMVSRHVARCAECRLQVQALREADNQLRQLALDVSDLPTGLNWNRLADEMTGNIRVGLAAGEAIALFDRPLRSKPRLGWHAALAAFAATLIFGIAFWSSLPSEQAKHLLTSLDRIRFERLGTLVHSNVGTTADDVVLEASSSSIQVKENGRAMSLIPRSDGATVSVSMHGSAGVRFVDTDTGQVTTNKVYYAEQ